MDLSKYTDSQLSELIQNRWNEASSLWDELVKVAAINKKFYKNEPEWMDKLTVQQSKVRNNRIFRDVESVISSLLSNLPKPNVVPGHDTEGSKQLSKNIEAILGNRYENDHTKAVLRRGLRGLYLSRLFLIKPYWDTTQNEMSVTWVNPEKVRISKRATKEVEAEAIIEEVDATLPQMLGRFPKTKAEILKKAGYPEGEAGEKQAYLENKEQQYKEAWIGDWLICQYQDIIIWKKKNPYWDWKGLLVTEDEYKQLDEAAGDNRLNMMGEIKAEQGSRRAEYEGEGASPTYKTYYYNYWDKPRKPYVFGSLFTMENKPFGETSLIEQAIPLQERVDEGKRQIAENAEWVNGMTLVDSNVMSKGEAEKLKYKPKSWIWGKGATVGVKRVTGTPLPQFVFDDMDDNRQEIDNMLGASAAFRGEREGTETKAGRLALIEQSYLQSNELVQVLNESCRDLFGWWFQLMRVKYTEYHYTKKLGKEGALTTTKLMQDEIDDGIQIEIIPGKNIPQDAQFKFQRAEEAIKLKLISPVDYFEETGFDDPKQTAKNALVYQLNPAVAVGMSPEEMMALQPPMGLGAGPTEGSAPGGEIPPEMMGRIKSVLESPEFKALPAEEQQKHIANIKAQLGGQPAA